MTAVQTRWWARALAALALAGLLVGCTTDAGAPTPTTQPTPTTDAEELALPDGDHLAYVRVGRGESGIILQVDTAEMLTGEEARQAAVDAGIIEEGEDLPNDFFILNPEEVEEPIALAGDARITVISGTDTSQQISVDAEQLEALFEGTYTGEAVYGIVAGQPIVMDLVIENGVVTEAHAVYLP